MKTFGALLLVLALGACSGGPLKEIPVLEAPPPPRPEPEPASDRPPPAAVPVPAPPAPELYGAWASTRLAGPGSAAFESLIACFERDGRCSFAAFGMGRTQARAGRFTERGESLDLDLDGDRQGWSFAFSGQELRLRSGDAEARFRRIR